LKRERERERERESNLNFELKGRIEKKRDQIKKWKNNQENEDKLKKNQDYGSKDEIKKNKI